MWHSLCIGGTSGVKEEGEQPPIGILGSLLLAQAHLPSCSMEKYIYMEINLLCFISDFRYLPM